MKNNGLIRVAVIATAVALGMPRGATAVPAFSRQTGVGCSSCHFQHFPALTSFGQAFKAGNYAEAGGQSMVEGDILSLPAVLNLSMILKVKYVNSSGVTGASTDKGEFMLPDEAAFFVGGRVGKNMGFLLEGQIADQDAPMFASFKLPIGFTVGSGRVSVVPFMTDGLGTPFGFELLSTGAVRNVRSFEERAATSAQQYVVGGSGEGIAEGVALVYSRSSGFANVTVWTPNHGNVALDRPTYYMRFAATPMVGSWQLGTGVQVWTGTPSTINKGTEALALDFQAHGQAGTFPLGIYVTWARAPGTTASDSNFFNAQPGAQSAFAVAGELGVWPQRLTVGLGYREGRNGLSPLAPPTWPVGYAGAMISRDVDRALTMSSTVMLAQNVELHASYSGFFGNAWAGRSDDRKLSITLFAAF